MTTKIGEESAYVSNYCYFIVESSMFTYSAPLDLALVSVISILITVTIKCR